MFAPLQDEGCTFAANINVKIEDRFSALSGSKDSASARTLLLYHLFYHQHLASPVYQIQSLCFTEVMN